MTGQAVELSILLVEDHRVFADVLAMRLRAEPNITGVEVAYSLADARSVLSRFSPEVVLLDLQLTGESGLDLMEDLDRLPVRPDVLVLSGFRDPGRIVAALGAGVQGWVSKESSFEVLVLAASEVRQGRMYLSPAAIKPVVRQLINEAQGDGFDPGFVDSLSRRELEVLRCLVAGMTRREIAGRLYLSVNTVRTHVQHLLRRAGQHSTLSLVSLARDLGVTGVDEDPPVGVPRQRQDADGGRLAGT
jgi:DNA-binding NarL/FixJ family response regulator